MVFLDGEIGVVMPDIVLGECAAARRFFLLIGHGLRRRMHA
jgi:hypothetical protein